MKKHTVRTLSAMMATALLLGACTSPAQPPAGGGGGGATGTTAADAPAGGGGADGDVRDELTVAMATFIISLDPVMQNDTPSHQVRQMIFEPLIRFDPHTQELYGVLATNWDMPDAQTVNFELRQGVYFSNGDRFTGHDVAYTFERALESSFTRAMFGAIDHVEVVDDYNVTFHLNMPFVPILNQLTFVQASIVNARAAQELGDAFQDSPVGTGPFVLDHMVLGDRTVVTRNDNYWGPAPHLRQVTFRVVPEQSNRFIEVETGNADIALMIAPTDVPRAEETPSVELHRTPNFSYNYIGFNMRSDGPIADERVRHAITYALDIDAIVHNAFAGTGQRLTGPVTSLTQYHIPMEPFTPNLDRARELLAEAGYPDGFSVRFWSNEGNQARADVGVMVQHQLREIGIEVTTEVVEWATYLERMGQAEHDMFILGWVGSMDPDFHLYMLFHSENLGTSGNMSWLDHPEVDRLLDEGRMELDPVRRGEIYAEFQQLIRDIRPHIFLHQSEELNISTPEVRGFRSSADVLPRFWQVYFE